MTKQKLFARPPKSFRPAPKEPDDENDFLEAADELEKAGGKWRAGDAAKAARFFTRAIEVYGQGLAKFPKSFDLHYNKARLLYDICEDERTSIFFGDDKVALLHEALQAHRAALNLDNANPDILFNTAQVLTSMGEALGESEEHDPEDVSKPIQEAIELFSSCLDIQEREYTNSQTMMQQSDTMTDTNTNPSDVDDAMDISSTTSSPPSQWATVLEPTTPSTLLDTALALLSALTTLLTFHSPIPAAILTTIHTIADPLLTTKIPSYIAGIPTSLPPSSAPSTTASLSITRTSATFHPDATTSSQATASNPQAAASIEAALTTATYATALGTAEYRLGHLTPETYLTQITSSFTALLAQSRTAAHILAYANALEEFNLTLVQTSRTDAPVSSAELRAQALSQAANLLLEASKMPGAETGVYVQVYFSLGDVYMARARAADGGADGRREMGRHAKTAGVYYRGAAAYARRGGVSEDFKEQGESAVVRGLVAEVVAGGEEKVWDGLRACGGEVVVGELEEMVEESLLDEGWKGEIEARLLREG